MPILVVDDDPLVLTMLSYILRENKYNVITAKNGKEALDIITSREDIQLMLLDLMMPELSGQDLLEIMDNQSIKIPVIVLSGYITTIRDKLKDRKIPLMTKPFNHGELIYQIEEGLKCPIN